jgi:hypothetical protein
VAQFKLHDEHVEVLVFPYVPEGQFYAVTQVELLRKLVEQDVHEVELVQFPQGGSQATHILEEL